MQSLLSIDSPALDEGKYSHKKSSVSVGDITENERQRRPAREMSALPEKGQARIF